MSPPGGAPRRAWQRVDGVLLLDKPAGISSNAALQRARRALCAAKAGHTGTLDPLASGLLPICLGEATKFAQFLLDAGKSYLAIIRLGVETDTLDAEGRVTATRTVSAGEEEVRSALAAMTGERLQRPPLYAALKYAGRPYYEYARAGLDVPREARAITVARLALVEWRPPDARVEVECSKGTYVRVLAAELGEALGCGAHLAGLRRTATGAFDASQATPLDRLEAMEPAARMGVVLPVDTMIGHLPLVSLDPLETQALLHGRDVPRADLPDGVYRCYAAGDALVGVADVAGGVLRARRLVRESKLPVTG